jgi:hypothetical protein
MAEAPDLSRQLRSSPGARLAAMAVPPSAPCPPVRELENDYYPLAIVDTVGAERDREYGQFLKKLPTLTTTRFAGVTQGVPESLAKEQAAATWLTMNAGLIAARSLAIDVVGESECIAYCQCCGSELRLALDHSPTDSELICPAFCNR